MWGGLYWSDPRNRLASLQLGYRGNKVFLGPKGFWNDCTYWEEQGGIREGRMGDCSDTDPLQEVAFHDC